MNSKKISVELIDDRDRLRSLNAIYVAEISASFENRGGEGKGQITAIEVREAGEDGRYRLISGAHRLAAARAAGWKSIEASIVRCTNEDARLREIDENLVRHDLSALDRAKFMAEREAIWVLQNPDSVQGKAGASKRWHASQNIGFASDAASKLGISEQTVRNWLDLDKALVWLKDDLRKRVAASDLANNRSELLALASIADQENRVQVIDLLLSEDENAPRKVAKALQTLAGKPLEPVRPGDHLFASFKRLWGKCDPDTRQRIVDHIAASKKHAKRQS